MTDECGVATVLACFAILALLATAILVVQFTAVVATRHRAQAAADLAALAAAGALASGDATACATARDLAAEMGTDVQDCVVEGWDVTVTVGSRTWFGGFGLRDVRAVARAGPVASEPG
ncbi:MAG TPA: Rv3654c family TadE-like protein [Aldersonia sp.]